MIESVNIRGLGVIEEASLPFGPGLTVVTGETGAGALRIDFRYPSPVEVSGEFR